MMSRKVSRHMFSLAGHPHPDTRILSITIAPEVTIRPTHAMTNVSDRGQVLIEQIEIGGDPSKTSCDNFLGTPLLLGPIDAYEWTFENSERIRTDFMHHLGLTTKEELYAYCEENDTSIPNPCRVEIPILKKGTVLRLTGQASRHSPFISLNFLFVLTLSGEVLEGSLP